MAEQWVRANLTIDVGIMGESVISWGNGVFTPVDAFVSMFGGEIENAIISGNDVRQVIRDSDNGRGFVDLI